MTVLSCSLYTSLMGTGGYHYTKCNIDISLVADYHSYKFVSQWCRALSDGLSITFTRFPNSYEVHRSRKGPNVICGHQLSRLALGATQQGQTTWVSYYMKVGVEKSVKAKVSDRSSSVLSSC